MNKFSVTLASLVGSVVFQAFVWADVQVAPEKVQAFGEVVVGLALVGGVWYGRWRKGDITWYGKRK